MYGSVCIKEVYGVAILDACSKGWEGGGEESEVSGKENVVTSSIGKVSFIEKDVWSLVL